MRSAANVSQTLRRTEWKSLLKRLPRTLAEYIGEERNRMNLHPDPQFALTPSLPPPDGIWYGKLDVTKLRRILKEHVEEG